ncbi:MAG: SO_0444 family Cu/Zn efflux transporter [gamma proteobacterium symbiont of Taylorina sp.]|nr:SO_0444 family Cu/Zn efflux transporter [gamma proteobacterium symbiont of Taylorina sp.]
MKQLILELLNNFWLLLNSIAFFILLGVLIAGIFKLLLPDALIKKHLGQHSFMANIKAAILGIPLPLCSCSVLPFISALKKSGASRSAIQTFLISTPITGADSILATYGVFGWIFTLYRVFTSIVIALVAGILTLFLHNDKEEEDKDKEKPVVHDKFSSFKVAEHLNYNVPGKPLKIKVVNADQQYNSVLFEKGQQILSYAFDDIYKDIARSLMIGVFIGACIVTFIPENLSDYISSSVFLNYFLVLLVSIPLYVCATASIPLGLSLLSAGFSPGAAFIFLTAGPATNTVTMSVVLNTLGKTSLLIYLSSVILGSLIFGFIFDSFFIESFNHVATFTEAEESTGFLAQVSSVILLYLSIMYSFNKKAKLINKDGCCSGGCGKI